MPWQQKSANFLHFAPRILRFTQRIRQVTPCGVPTCRSRRKSRRVGMTNSEKQQVSLRTAAPTGHRPNARAMNRFLPANFCSSKKNRELSLNRTADIPVRSTCARRGVAISPTMGFYHAGPLRPGRSRSGSGSDRFCQLAGAGLLCRAELAALVLELAFRVEHYIKRVDRFFRGKAIAQLFDGREDFRLGQGLGGGGATHGLF
jgi:hypothetical protein